MAIKALLILHISIVIFFAVFLCRSPKVRAWSKAIWKSPKVRRRGAIGLGFILAIIIAFLAYPSSDSPEPDSEQIFQAYSSAKVSGLAAQGAIVLDSSFQDGSVKSELAYMLPTILKVYNDIVEKPTTPRLLQLNDTLKLSFDGYKQFKNRGIRILKKLQQDLGKRYTADIQSRGSSHILYVVYNGAPWDNEQLVSLPATEASLQNQVDPAILMSLIRHTSDFDFNYEGEKNLSGLLALDSGNGLEQVFIGAQHLRAALAANATEEDAIASLYPIHDIQRDRLPWKKDPLKATWVKEVLNDAQFYRNNGITPSREPVPSQR